MCNGPRVENQCVACNDPAVRGSAMCRYHNNVVGAISIQDPIQLRAEPKEVKVESLVHQRLD